MTPELTEILATSRAFAAISDDPTQRLVGVLVREIERADAARDDLAEAREAFLCLIADAKRWDEDVDGEYHTDSPTPTMTVRYFGEFSESGVRDLVEALGIKVHYDELAGAAIERRLEEDYAAFRASAEDPIAGVL